MADAFAKDVLVMIGVGGIGQAMVRRQGAGKTVLLADFNEATLEAAAQALGATGLAVTTQRVDISDRASVRALADKAASLGRVSQVVNTAGVSPNMAPPDRILAVDLYGAAVVFEEFERVIAPGGSGLVISSMAGHMPPAFPTEMDQALAYTPADDLLALPYLQPSAVPDSGAAYAVSKRANHLRVQAAALSWGERGARVNAISPGVILTPLAQHELDSAVGPVYRTFIDASPAKRMGTADEVAAAAAFLMGPEAGFITGSDLLMDGGVIAALRAGRIQLARDVGARTEA
jgi:NAD(P)-dependent dehydrogenase (short-subunit alcohol dehydrogenase family)